MNVEPRPDRDKILADLDKYRWAYEYDHIYWDNGHGQSEHNPHCTCPMTGRKRKVWDDHYVPGFVGAWE